MSAPVTASVYAATDLRLTTVSGALTTPSVTSMATVDVSPTGQDSPANATSAHATAAAAHALAQPTRTVASVSTTPIWTTMVHVCVTSTGPERTVPYRLTTPDNVLVAATVAVPAHLLRTA